MINDPDRPLCDYCQLPMCKNGANPSGAKVYKCHRGCVTDSGGKPTKILSDRPVGRPKLEKRLTQAEYTARWKERDPDGYRAAMKRKQEKQNEKRKANRKAKEI